MSTPPLDLTELRKTAERAEKVAPGEWDGLTEPGDRKRAGYAFVAAGDFECRIDPMEASGLIGHHMAAFDPPTVIQLLDQIDILSRNVELTRHQRGEQQARATTAEATIARVRELHNKTYVTVENQVWGRDPRCSECHDAYPCPTIQALDGSAS